MLPRRLLVALPLLLLPHISAAVEEEAVWETMLPPSESPSRLKRFALRRKRWAKSTLTWRLHSQHLNEADVFIVRNTLHRAFNEWAAAASSAARFRELPADNGRPADINIAFERGRHTDAFPFDGPDGVVAHAFYPRDGKLHFDADEKWTLNRAEGVNLYQTALHEIGHIIGLEHSSDPRSAMFHKKKAFDARFMLAEDDLRAIRELFPRRPPLLVLPSPPTSTTTSKSTSTSTSTTRSPSTTTEQDSNEDY